MQRIFSVLDLTDGCFCDFSINWLHASGWRVSTRSYCSFANIEAFSNSFLNWSLEIGPCHFFCIKILVQFLTLFIAFGVCYLVKRLILCCAVQLIFKIKSAINSKISLCPWLFSRYSNVKCGIRCCSNMMRKYTLISFASE